TTTYTLSLHDALPIFGHHLVKRLKSDGHWVRGVDIKYPEYEVSASDEFEILDLRTADNCLLATRSGIDEVYNLAADMGGIGYIRSEEHTSELQSLRHL